MSGEFAISLSREDFISAYWLYTRWLWLWRRLLIGFVLVGLFYSGLMIGIDAFGGAFEAADWLDYLKYGAIYSLVVSVALIAVTLVTLPRRLKRLYDDHKVAGRETRFEFDAAGLRTSNRDGSSNLEWSRFKHSVENDRFLMFVLSRWSFIIIPKAQATEDVLAKLRCTAAAGGLARR